MRRAVIAWVMVSSTLGLAVPSAAQIQPPTTATGGLFGQRAPVDPTRVSREFTATVDFLAGYDDNTDSGDGVNPPNNPLGVLQSGTITAAAASANYRWGDATTFIDGSGRGYASYASAGVDQLVAGNVSVNWEAAAGRRAGLMGDVNFSYDPTYLYNAFAPITQDIGVESLPGATPSQGVNEQTFLSRQASIGLYRRWTARQRMDVRYGVSRRRPTSGPGFDSRTQSLTLRHDWRATRSRGVRLSYDFQASQQQNDLVEIAPEQDVRLHDVRAGLDLERRWSETRAFVVSFGVGATWSWSNFPSVNGDDTFLTPTGYGTVRYDVNRAWSLSADYSRAVSMLTSLTPEPFVTDAVSLRIDGTVERRIQLMFMTAVSQGASLLTQTGAFDTKGGTVQVQFAATRTVALFTSYSYYLHHLIDVRGIPLGFPDNYQRNAVRVGLTLWLPLYGAR